MLGNSLSSAEFLFTYFIFILFYFLGGGVGGGGAMIRCDNTGPGHNTLRLQM